MAITLLIKGSPIVLSESGGSPNWAPGVIAALKALTDAVNSVTGTYDVQPQTQDISANNASTDVNITNLVFPSTEVRAATIFYSVYRKTDPSGPPDGEEVAEGGVILIVYNASNPVGNKFELARDFAGDAKIRFEISDTGQVTFTTQPLGGVDHIGTISFRAISVLNQA